MDRIGYRIQLRLKQVQSAIRTWKNRQEIEKAYQSSSFLVRVYPLIIPGILICAGAMLIMILSVGGIRVMQAFSSEPDSPGVSAPGEVPYRNIQDSAIHDNTSLAGSAAPDTVVDTFPDGDELIAKSESLGVSMMPVSDTVEYAILVNKRQKVLYLFRSDGPRLWKIHRQYPVAMGANDGPKMYEGDRRTPEGMYFIIGRKEGEELSDIYGPMAYVLNYPNDADVSAGRTGAGIWIHGTAPDSMPLRTRGCLELRNDRISELSRFLGPGIGVPVVIVDSTYDQTPQEMIDFSKLAEERRSVLTRYRYRQYQFALFLNNWKSAWESQDLDLYADFYDRQKFYSQGMSWHAWKERKKGTFIAYDTISVLVSNVVLSDLSDTAAVLKFVQFYKSDKYRGTNGKKLALRLSENQWKIYRETTFPEEELLL